MAGVSPGYGDLISYGASQEKRVFSRVLGGPNNLGSGCSVTDEDKSRRREGGTPDGAHSGRPTSNRRSSEPAPVLGKRHALDSGRPGCWPPRLRMSRPARRCMRWGRPLHSPRQRQTRADRFGNISIRPRSRTGSDPSAALFRLNACKDPDLARYQEANRFYRKPDPADVGDDRDAFATGNMLKPKIEIVPRGTRKS
jgi:hypothetical protein